MLSPDDINENVMNENIEIADNRAATVGQEHDCVLNASSESTTLFGEPIRIRTCVFCGKPLDGKLKRKKYCDHFCRRRDWWRREQELEQARENRRRAAALVWIHEHEGVIQSIIGSALADKQKGMVKGSFRRYWENVKLQFPGIPFDNTHVGFVNRYIQENIPSLRGFFRIRNQQPSS